jgi:mRNA interferase RelE/StbE
MSDDPLWEVNYHADLEKELRSIPKPYIRNILEAIEALGVDPWPPGCTKLAGYELWRIKVGSYRVLYEVDVAGHAIYTYRVGPRKDVYRKL